MDGARAAKGIETTHLFWKMLSVVICTHNPRRDYLTATLESLRRQTLPPKDWELIIVDNGSTPALTGTIDLSWHPAGRIAREDELGLTPARLCGLKEATADVVLYVDDDNVLVPSYLADVVRLGREWPALGGWGAGVLHGVYENAPPEWMAPYLWFLSVHQVEADRWSNKPEMWSFPPGAGLAVRRAAAEAHFEIVRRDPFRKSLDRRGTSLSSSGDMDMLWTITERGWGVGRFTCLKLDHLMSAGRTDEAYLERLMANQWCSNVLLKYLHGVREIATPESLRGRISRWRYERGLAPRARWAYEAERRGRLHAAQIIAELERGNREVRQSL